mmetsp:Transcript_46497/g.72774  ORF Transcript_46497/g.72774 Transcript_46497/m.72774 type:complete len:87 (+) Transcript_46497:48-308(+)
MPKYLEHLFNALDYDKDFSLWALLRDQLEQLEHPELSQDNQRPDVKARLRAVLRAAWEDRRCWWTQFHGQDRCGLIETVLDRIVGQ